MGRGVLKVVGRGGLGKLRDSYCAYNKKKKIFDKVYVCNIMPKIPWKSHVSTIISQNRFCLLFVYIVSDCEYCQNFKGALALWRHNDVMVWYFFISMERRDP